MNYHCFLKYLRNTIADSSKSISKLKNLEGIEVSWGDITKGKLAAEKIEELFPKNQKNSTRSVFIFPLTLLPTIKHGYNSYDDIITPLCMAANLDDSGVFSRKSNTDDLWIVRDVLEPSDNKLIIGTLKKSDKFLTQKQAKNLNTWSEFVKNAEDYFTSVTKSSFDNFSADGYEIYGATEGNKERKVLVVKAEIPYLPANSSLKCNG